MKILSITAIILMILFLPVLGMLVAAVWLYMKALAYSLGRLSSRFDNINYIFPPASYNNETNVEKIVDSSQWDVFLAQHTIPDVERTFLSEEEEQTFATIIQNGLK